jgi:parallel beta-helix repeat protein
MNKKMAGLALAAALVSPPAWADPTVITACQTISQSGSYVLANDIINGAADACLTINTDNVTINLAGFSVAGRNFAILALGSTPQVPLHGITVRNGYVSSRNGSAVTLIDAVGSIVEGVHASSFEGGGIEAGGIIRGNVVSAIEGFSPGTGIAAGGIVTDNFVSGFGVGISAGGTVRGNVAINNSVGIEVGAGSTVIGNSATGNTKAGIQADCPSNLTDNTAVNNGTNLVLNGQGCHNEDNVAP